jgi:hypothetical protein
MDNLINASELETYIQSNLYNFNASKELAWAWNSGENVILFGPGGYGKSDAAVAFHSYLRQKGIVDSANPFTMSFGQGMTEEKLLGGIDMPQFQSTGEIVYLLQNAFIEHEVVVFEELWDAFPAVLLILKDILQSKCVRMGNQVMPIKTKIVIACTNRSRDEVVEDASTEALMQRFLFEKEVAWQSHTPGDYLKALRQAVANIDTDLAQSIANICANSNNDSYIVSPRTCGKAYKSALINGIESLHGMHGLTKGLKDFEKLQKNISERKEQVKFMETQIKLLNELKKQVTQKKSFRHCASLYVQMYDISLDIREYAVCDELVEQKETTMQDIFKMFALLHEYMEGFVVNPPKDSVPYKFMRRMGNRDWSRARRFLR